MTSKLIGILGGTFDPIHLGHLRMASELSQKLPFSEIRFIPCQLPVHKNTTHATTAQRLAMLKLAVQGQGNFVVDERELHRKSPSYTVMTLRSLREEFPHTPFGLILGADLLASFTTWHHWKEILTLAHLIVVPRPQYTLPQGTQAFATWMKTHLVSHAKPLTEKPAGYIFLEKIDSLDISSTEIRAQITKGLDVHTLLPQKVWEYIQKNHIYA